MKKINFRLILVVILIIILIGPLLAYIFNKIYYLDRVNFLPPIGLKTDFMPIRHDLRGQGDFNAPRRGRRVHQGIDILAEVGTPVRVVKSGRTYAKNQPQGLGKYIELIHPNGLVTIYAHLSSFEIKSGQKVRQGQIIGYIGKTGNARYSNIQSHLHSHLHFEIRKNGNPVDPLNGYLKSIKVVQHRREREAIDD